MWRQGMPCLYECEKNEMLPQGCFSKLRLSVHFVINHGRYPWLEICRPFRALLLLQKDTTKPLISPCGVHGTTCPVAHCPALCFVKQNSSAGYSQLALITVSLAKVIANSAMGSEILCHWDHHLVLYENPNPQNLRNLLS